MGPDVTEEIVPHDATPIPDTHCGPKSCGGSGDFDSPVECDSERRYPVDPNAPDSFCRSDHATEGECRASIGKASVESSHEGPHGSFRGFFGNKQTRSKERPPSLGRRTASPRQSPLRPQYSSDYHRYSHRRRFGDGHGPWSQSGCRKDHGRIQSDGHHKNYPHPAVPSGDSPRRKQGYGGSDHSRTNFPSPSMRAGNFHHRPFGSSFPRHSPDRPGYGRPRSRGENTSYRQFPPYEHKEGSYGKEPFSGSRRTYPGREYWAQYPYGPERYGQPRYGGPDYDYRLNRSHNYWQEGRCGQFGGHRSGRSGDLPPFSSFSRSGDTHPTTLELPNEERNHPKGRSSRGKEMSPGAANFDLQGRKPHEIPAGPLPNPEYAVMPFQRRLPYFPMDTLRVDFVDFLPKENSKDHKTFPYELVQRDRPASVLRRGQSFIMEVTFQNRDFHPKQDCMLLNFFLGPTPSVPKKTRIVLPIMMQKEFQNAPHQWDVRVQNQEKRKIILQVHIPTKTAVGCWNCVVETGFRNYARARLQYRSPMNMYIIFNPFSPDDATFMENDDFRTEYIMNENGKIFMGGFKSAKGRPWIYGQFADCVLPAACVLLEMSKLSHSEWGNPTKVVRAISAMIKAARSGSLEGPHFAKSKGVIIPYYEDDFRGGSSPHLWTGSVQIIEEFLKGGASPVKYGQCWIMAAIMTTICRSLGLASRPVTAFMAAFNTQDSMTIDKYINRYGDVLECGPGRDQPDSLWCFHTWCDVWMMRPDLPIENSGWQACDPSRSGGGNHELFNSSCGPCSLEAIRKGQLGFQKDCDGFYSLLNAYVRYFYETEQSEWGFLPFMQFRLPVAQYILTKAPNCLDVGGDEDFEDVTNLYKDINLLDEQRFFIYNAFRGRPRDATEFDLNASSSAYSPVPLNGAGEEVDVKFDFHDPISTLLGEPVTFTIEIHNTSEVLRTIHANMSCRSVFYTGVMGPRIKRVTGRFTFEAGQGESLAVRLDPVEYQEKLIDLSFVKITMTGFVMETMQSWVREFDFRFDKPRLMIEMPDECAEGKKCAFELSFMNPLGMTLTECFVTFEINGAVRPETIQIDRDVGSREKFSFQHSFVPRQSGLRNLVACFTSKQLSDINGVRKILIEE